MEPITYPDSSTLVSSALTISPNGGTLGKLLTALTLGMIGQKADVNSPMVRLEWAPQGQPWQQPNEDVCYLRCAFDDDPYDKIRERTDLPNADPYLNEQWNYTRVWRIGWIFYGPNAVDYARIARSALYQEYFLEQLSLARLFPMSEIAAPMRIPEKIGAQWFERSDVECEMYEFVTENILRQTVSTAEVIVLDAEGVIADIGGEDSISGNVGAAGVSVYWYDTTSLKGNVVISDALGNYSIGPIPAGTYAVIPVKPGWTYTPRYQIVNVAGGISTADFASPVELVNNVQFTQLFEDTFQRPNESPLNPAVWSQAFENVTEVVNDECVINILPPNPLIGVQGASRNIALNWDGSIPDHFIEATVEDMLIGGASLYVRASGSGFGQLNPATNVIPCYRLLVTLASESTTTGYFSLATAWSLDQVDETGGVTVFSWDNSDEIQQPMLVQPGDRIAFGIIGDGVSGNLYIFLNRALIYKAPLSLSSVFLGHGSPGFALESLAGQGLRNPDGPQSLHDVGLSDVKLGSLALV